MSVVSVSAYDRMSIFTFKQKSLHDLFEIYISTHAFELEIESSHAPCHLVATGNLNEFFWQ
jgi:hypothetical protein